MDGRSALSIVQRETGGLPGKQVCAVRSGMRKQARSQTTNRQKLAALDYITKLRAPSLSIKKIDLLALFDHKYCYCSIDAWRRGRYRMPPAAFAILESKVEAMIQALRKALDELRPPEHHSGLE